jgi:NodT family efflux transporter outer membrane factor (OMF) lipoprotein
MRSQRTFRSVAAAAAIFASACSTSTGAIRSTVAIPARFQSGGSAQLADRWWTSFGDPELDRLIEASLQHNPGLLAIWARLDGANAQAGRSGAERYPTLEASARGGARASAERSIAPEATLGLAAQYEIDLWGRIGATHDAAVIEVQASEMDVRAAAISLSAEIASTWYELVARRAEHALLSSQAGLAQRTLDLTTERFEHGLVPQVDVLRQEQNVESIRGNLAQAEENIALLEHALAVLVGRPPAERVAAETATLLTLPALPATGVPSELLQRRPDVRSSFLHVQSADKNVAASIAAQYPRINLSAAISTAVERPDQALQSWAASLIGGLVAPLFDGGQAKADVARARAALSERVHGYAQSVLEALQEIEDALISEQQQRARFTSLQRQLQLARDAHAKIEAAYGAGLSSYLDVLNANESVQSLERQQLQAQLGLIETRIGLCRALSGSWSMTRPTHV